MSNEMEELNEAVTGMISAMDRMMERMDKMRDMCDEMMTEIDNISSKKMNDDAVASMREKWDTTGPR
jgi:uncharacterized coiled-coil protein SlyX